MTGTPTSATRICTTRLSAYACVVIVMAKDVQKPELDERTRGRVIDLLGTELTIPQIAERCETTPRVVMQIRADLSKSIDELTMDEMMAKALINLNRIINMALSEFKTVEDMRNGAPLLQTAVTATKTLIEKMEKHRDRNKGQVETLNRKRQSELITLMQQTVNAGVDEISDIYDLPKQDLFDVFNRKLIEAATEMELRNAEQL